MLRDAHCNAAMDAHESDEKKIHKRLTNICLDDGKDYSQYGLGLDGQYVMTTVCNVKYTHCGWIRCILHMHGCLPAGRCGRARVKRKGGRWGETKGALKWS